MRVKCIDNQQLCDLTTGKTYEVVDEYNNCYFIINDNDKKYWGYPKEWFKSLSEIRNETINKLLA